MSWGPPMDSRILVLPNSLVTKIAAGEVIERPASVIKELVENAIDAEADRIAILVEDGGKRLIRVTDDGCGMSPDELRLAVAPHATSKIHCDDDLYSIRTMGFRGEALASISSIAKLRILSRRPDSIEGHELCVVGEKVESSRDAAGPPGTSVEVRDLFFNVPARRRFLRTPATEMGRIHDQLTRIALAFPSIGFELSNNGRLTHQLPACAAVPDRIAKLFSPELASALIPIRREERGVGLEAYAAPPSQSRATAQWQYTFLNGRCIRDRYLQHAIKEAYRGLMEPGRHGVAFLFLSLDPSAFDVNVHPTKAEVRWTDSQLIHSQVLSALRETFQRSDLTPRLRTPGRQPEISEAQQDRARREMADLLKATEPIRPVPRPHTSPQSAGPSTSSQGARWARPSESNVEAAAVWQALYGRDQGKDASALEEGQTESLPRPTGAGTQRTAAGRAIQMHNLYLVAETEEGIVIVDQHALHERVLYEQLRERLTAGPLESQRLLLPETLQVGPHQMAVLEAHHELLTLLGIEWSPFGADTVALQAFPVILKDTQVLPFMQDLLDRLEQQDAQTPPDVVLDGLLSMMACKAAVKAGDPLTAEEIDALFQQRELADKASSCPHGRPTMLRLTKADLDRQFKRT